MRTIFDIDAASVAELERLARRDGTSRAGQIRKAVSGYLEERRRGDLHASTGRWRGAPDGLAWRIHLRETVDPP